MQNIKQDPIQDYSRQCIDDEDIEEVVKALRGRYITQGDYLKLFESALGAYCGSRFCVAFSSGTAALHAAYFSAGIGEGDEVITTPYTFSATSNALLFLGATPVFCDIDYETGCIDPDKIENLITERTKAIVPVDFAGHPAEIDAIKSIARKYNLLVIEDACHALGAEYKGKRIGSLSDLTIFSFHPVKSITTGEGGAVLTNREDLYERLLLFRNHGMKKEKNSWLYDIEFLAPNYRISDINCALGFSQLKKLDNFIEKRRRLAYYYQELLSDMEMLGLPREKSWAKSSWHLFPLKLKGKSLIERKKEIFQRLKEKGIGVQVHYIPVYHFSLYKKLGYTTRLENTERLYSEELSIPLHQGMGERDVERVCSALKEVIFDYYSRCGK